MEIGETPVQSRSRQRTAPPEAYHAMSIWSRLVRLAKPVLRRIPFVVTGYKRFWDSREMLRHASKTPLGFTLLGDRGMEGGRYETDETEHVRTILGKVDVFVNVGANIGYYCCMALQKGRHTVAFEPLPRNLRFLYRNLRQNGWHDGVEIYPVALSDRVGIAELFGARTAASLVRGWAAQSERNGTLVPVSTLDTVLGSRFHRKRCFVLVDVEGVEQLVLEGASSFLCTEPKPIWMVEVFAFSRRREATTFNPHLLSTFRIFWERGYEAWTAGRQVRLVTVGELEEIARTGLNTLPSDNFLFIESGRKAELLDR
jgi:FkbM family methyltransferase